MGRVFVKHHQFSKNLHDFTSQKNWVCQAKFTFNLIVIVHEFWNFLPKNPDILPRASPHRNLWKMFFSTCLSICLTQMMDPATGGISLTPLIRNALLWGYWILNFSWRASISSLTRWINWVWYSRMAPRMWGRTNKALNLMTREWNSAQNSQKGKGGGVVP